MDEPPSKERDEVTYSVTFCRNKHIFAVFLPKLSITKGNCKYKVPD